MAFDGSENRISRFANQLKSVYDNDGDYTDLQGIYYPPLDPPTILNASASGKIVVINYFGAVGATSYKLYRSTDPKNMTLYLNDIQELDDYIIKDESKENGLFKCSTKIYYHMVSYRDDNNALSPPVKFEVLVPVENEPDYCKPTKSESIDASDSSFNSGLIIGLVASSAFLVSCALAFIYLRRQSIKLDKIIAENLARQSQDLLSVTYTLGRKSM